MPALQHIHNGPGPANGIPWPGLTFMPHGLVPMQQTIIQPGQPITLNPPVNVARVAEASCASAQQTQWIVDQVARHQANMNATAAAA